MTVADVEIVEAGAILRQDGKTLKLENLSHPDIQLSRISLEPPFLQLDRKIENQRRLEPRIPTYLFDDKETS